MRILTEYASPSQQIAVKNFGENLLTLPTITVVNFGRQLNVSRDPKDNMFLHTAHSGRARYIVSQDRDLLGIDAADLRGFRFQILAPRDFLDAINH